MTATSIESNEMAGNIKKQRKATKCSRGHTFYHSSDCPVCPVCWSGYYKQKNKGDLPDSLSGPALRALLNEKIYNLKDLSKYTEEEVLALHGMGPSSIPVLHRALTKKELTFKKT